jgi:predicted RNase H-like HicB family nuclease
MVKNIIKADIYFDGDFYCGRCIDFDVFTQGKTLDELTRNLKEAIQLHFEDDPESLSDYIQNPTLFTTMDLGGIHV